MKPFAEWSTSYNRPSTKVLIIYFFCKNFYSKTLHNLHTINEKILPKFTSTVVELFSTCRDASVTRKAPKKLFLFIPRIMINKKKTNTVYDDTRRPQGSAFRKTGCCPGGEGLLIWQGWGCSVSFRGLIQNFRRASPPLSYSEYPPGGVTVMQFLSKNRANFVKITAILKWLVHELSLLSWTSRPLFAHFINFSKGLHLILPLKRFGIFKRFIFGV